MEEFLAPAHFVDGAEVLCLGGGGAGTAIAWYLAQRPDRPAAMHFIDRESRRLEHLEKVVSGSESGPVTGLSTSLLEHTDVERAVAALPPGSLVINATGLGKDRPGSPLPPGTVLPERGVVWELNYRGELDFLHQARAQARARNLTVIDGWRYFIHGWSQVVGEVFDIDMTAELVDELAAAAEATR
jgi:shikimate 5-dehydrogenase